MLRLALDSAMARELISKNPAKLIKNLARTDRQERRPFTIQALKTVLTQASAEWKTTILVGFYTGLRLGDVIRLRWENLDLEAGHYSLKTKKTGRHVINPIAQPLLEHLLAIKKTVQGPFVYPTFCDKESKELSNSFHDLLAKVGLVKKKDYRHHQSDGDGRQYSGLSFHCLRQTISSFLGNTGASRGVAGDIVGHDSEAMTRHYTKIDLETKRAAIAKLPAL